MGLLVHVVVRALKGFGPRPVGAPSEIRPALTLPYNFRTEVFLGCLVGFAMLYLYLLYLANLLRFYTGVKLL